MPLFTQNQTQPRIPFQTNTQSQRRPDDLLSQGQKSEDALRSAFEGLLGDTPTSNEAAQVEKVSRASKSSINSLSNKTPLVVDSAFQEKNPSASPKVPVGDALKSSTSKGTPQARFFSTTDSRSEIVPLKFDPSQKASQEKIDKTDMTPIISASERLGVETPQNDEDLEQFKELTLAEQASDQISNIFAQNNDAFIKGAERDRFLTFASQDRIEAGTGNVAEIQNAQEEIEAGTGNIAKTKETLEAEAKAKELFDEFDGFASPRLNCLPGLDLGKYFEPDIPVSQNPNVTPDITDCVLNSIDREVRKYCGINSAVPGGNITPRRTPQNMINSLIGYAVDKGLGSIAENLLSGCNVDESTRKVLKRVFSEGHESLDWRSVKAITGTMKNAADWPFKETLSEDIKKRNDIQTDDDAQYAIDAAKDVGLDPKALFKRPGFEAGTGNRVDQTVNAEGGNILDVWDAPVVKDASSSLAKAVVDGPVRRKIGGTPLNI